MYQTHSYEGMIAETVPVIGANGDWIDAYIARPLGPDPFAGIVMVHHMPGWDAWYKEATRKMAAQGYIAICPDLYHRAGPGSPDDVAAKVRAEGGVSDAQVVADLGGCVNYLRAMPQLNGKVGIFANNASQDTLNIAGSTLPGGGSRIALQAGRGSTDFASLYEGALTAKVRVTSRISVRGGYQVLFVQGLALAPTQLAATGSAIQKSFVLVPGSFVPPGFQTPPTTFPTPGTGAGLNTNGNVFLHGPFVGLDVAF